jgi:hypothetical protein
VITVVTKEQLTESMKRLAFWNHSSSLLARAIFDAPGEWWLRDTYIGLLLGNSRVYRLLNHSLELQELTIAALAARNALEMKVWIHYAAGGEKDARRLYDDQTVDARDIMARANGLLSLVPDDKRPVELDLALRDSQNLLNEKGPEFGSTEEDRYLRTHSLAQQVGCGQEFKGMFPILSKLMHPTALSMFLNHSGETNDSQLLNICNIGVYYFANNVDHLNAHLKASGFPHIHQVGDRLEIKR